MMINKYKKPWKVEYNVTDWHGNIRPLPHDVDGIVDCDGETVVETDMGAYAPDAETAEYIVKVVNEHKEE